MTAGTVERIEAPAGGATGRRRLWPVVARRLLGALAVVYGAATVAFVALQLIPGNAVTIMIGFNNAVSPQVRAQIQHDLGLNHPVIVQYFQYLGHLAHGDLGTSYQLNQSVASLIGAQFWPTFQLMLAAVGIAVLLALLSALGTASRRGGLRAVVDVVELVLVSTPTFWLGILLLTAFSFRLRLFPVAGAQSAASLVLPALTLALPIAGVLAQVLREGLETALGQPFVITARSRGLRRSAVRLRHALRHAAAPMVTLVGWLSGSLLGNAVLVESVFGRPGIGALTLEAVQNKDMPVVMGVVLVSAVAFVVISTLVDLLYLLIDPRLRTG